MLRNTTAAPPHPPTHTILKSPHPPNRLKLPPQSNPTTPLTNLTLIQTTLLPLPPFTPKTSPPKSTSNSLTTAHHTQTSPIPTQITPHNPPARSQGHSITHHHTACPMHRRRNTTPASTPPNRTRDQTHITPQPPPHHPSLPPPRPPPPPPKSDLIARNRPQHISPTRATLRKVAKRDTCALEDT